MLYPGGRMDVSRSEVVDFVRGYLPLVGWLVIVLQEVVWLKYALIAFFAAIGSMSS